jgi:hypothetical protein
MNQGNSFVDATVWIDWHEAKVFQVTVAEDGILAVTNTASDYGRQPVAEAAEPLSRVAD